MNWKKIPCQETAFLNVYLRMITKENTILHFIKQQFIEYFHGINYLYEIKLALPSLLFEAKYSVLLILPNFRR